MSKLCGDAHAAHPSGIVVELVQEAVLSGSFRALDAAVHSFTLALSMKLHPFGHFPFLLRW